MHAKNVATQFLFNLNFLHLLRIAPIFKAAGTHLKNVHQSQNR